MEALMATLTTFGVFVVGMLVRFALLLLVLMLLSVPILVIVIGLRGAELLWQRVAGLVPVGGLLWKAGLYYAPGHTWIRRKGRALRIGIDDLAQRVLLGAQVIDLLPPGTEVHQGEPVTRVTCGDKRTAIASPVDGTVAAVNERVSKDPSVIHREPYAHGWLLEVVPANSRYRRLPRGRRAQEWFRAEAERLMQFLERDLGVAAADGGEFVFSAPSLLTAAQWDALTQEFLGMRRGEPSPPEKVSAAWHRALVPFKAVGGATLGGLYIIFFPVIGLAMLLGFSALWVWKGVRHGFSRIATRISGPVRP